MKRERRYKLKEFTGFVRNLRADYNNGTTGPSKTEKRSAYVRTVGLLCATIYNAITAPLIYPFWYAFRKKIIEKCYKGTDWTSVNALINDGKLQDAKNAVMKNGRFWYWLWTYGDLRDPLGRGELPEDKPNNFWTRYWENAFRNPRFTVNFVDWRTAPIVESVVVLDRRDFTYMHKSEGIGDSPDGVYFKWMKDADGKWVFIYEDNTVDCIFYYGFVGLLSNEIGKMGRFECGYRNTDSSYRR